MSGHAPAWAELGQGARLFRLAHGVWGAFNIAALVYVWYSAMARRRDGLVGACVGLLGAEGIALLIGRGNCPLGAFQRKLGDPVPMFEWFLPPRAAKAAIPALTGVTALGLLGLALRPPR